MIYVKIVCMCVCVCVCVTWPINMTAAYLVSNCGRPRDLYISRLLQILGDKVHSYGRCVYLCVSGGRGGGGGRGGTLITQGQYYSRDSPARKYYVEFYFGMRFSVTTLMIWLLAWHIHDHLCRMNHLSVPCVRMVRATITYMTHPRSHTSFMCATYPLWIYCDTCKKDPCRVFYCSLLGPASTWDSQ